MNHADPLTIIVRRRIKVGDEQRFEAAMREFVGFALAFPGHVDIQVLRSGAREYTVVDRFADRAAREAFVADPEYRDRLARLRELSEAEPQFQEFSGLGGWFVVPGHPSPPPRAKMAAVTFLGVYPLTSILPPLFAGLLPNWHPLLRNVLVTGLIVASLTWIVMPFLTRALAPWLHPKETSP